MKIFDTHAHLDDSQFEADRDELLKTIHSEGVEFVVNCGFNIESSQDTVKLTEEYDFIYGAVGFHPDETGDMFETGENEEPAAVDLPFNKTALDKLEQMLEKPKILALGEIGLDYHWDRWPRELQRRGFVKQWELARKHNKPIIIHSRDAAEDTLSIVKEMCQQNRVLGIEQKIDMHCYSYSVEQAKLYCELGLFFGVGGVATFKNAKKLHEVLEFLPLDRILTETDCPYLAPEPFRGKRNDPSYISYVIKKIAEIKGLETEAVAEQLMINARSFYGI